jgi:hypothetical protein
MSTKNGLIVAVALLVITLVYLMLDTPVVVEAAPVAQSNKQRAIPNSNPLEPTGNATDKSLSAPAKDESSDDEQLTLDEPLRAHKPMSSMAAARLYGDHRTPPIERSAKTRVMPTQQELDNPDLYSEYEARNKPKVYKSFYRASEKKLEMMEALVEQGRKNGASEKNIREGEEKIAAMKAMRLKLEKEHDDLND